MIVLPLSQGTPDWLAWRLGGLGGSDAAPIIGHSPYLSRAELLQEKIHGTRRESTFAMRRGQRLEAVARDLYTRTVGCIAEPVCVRHPDRPWLLGSLDGLCRPLEPAADDPAPWLVEIKAPKWQDHDTALAGLVPTHYWPQVQHLLLATGLDRLDYVSFTDHSRFSADDRLAVVAVEPDPEYQARLLDAEEAFWAEVEAGRAKKAGKAVARG